MHSINHKQQRRTVNANNMENVSLKQLTEKSGHINAKLIKRVVAQFGGWEQFKQSAPDVTNHGIDGGFGGWIYYSETHEFAMKNRALIVELLEDTAAQFGEELVDMVSRFGVFRNSPMDADDRKDLYKFIGGGRPQQGTITNVLAWFAAEEVCRAYSYLLEEVAEGAF